MHVDALTATAVWLAALVVAVICLSFGWFTTGLGLAAVACAGYGYWLSRNAWY